MSTAAAAHSSLHLPDPTRMLNPDSADDGLSRPSVSDIAPLSSSLTEATSTQPVRVQQKYWQSITESDRPHGRLLKSAIADHRSIDQGNSSHEADSGKARLYTAACDNLGEISAAANDNEDLGQRRCFDKESPTSSEPNLEKHKPSRGIQQRRLSSVMVPSEEPVRASKPPISSTQGIPQLSIKPLSQHTDTKHASWCTCDEDDSSANSKDILSVTDVEARGGLTPPSEKVQSHTPAVLANMPGGGRAPDSFTITFDGPHDPSNPKNWPARRKWATTACIAAFTFLSPLTSTMVAPALSQISRDFGITNAVETQLLLSIFVLAFAIGPMLLGPLSELYGRVLISQGSNVFFLVFNTLCGFAQTKNQLMAFRFLAGLGGSAPLAIGGSVLGDLFKPEERGKAMGLFAMGPLLGPSIGPVVGGWVAERSTWRWMFWAVSIANCFIFAAGMIWFQESYAPFILHKKAKKIRTETNQQAYWAEGESDVNQPVWKKVFSTMSRSFGMLWTQPIVQVMALYMGFSYGLLYLMLSTYTELFLDKYQESVGTASLNFISLGLGFFVGAPLCGKTSDVVYKRLKARDPQRRGRPEFRMPVVLPFACLVPVGILIYGWSAQYKTHWIVPNLGAFVFGIGTIAAFQCVTTYLVDTYTRFAASAVAAVTILRSLMGFCFPLFAPAMYHRLDYGWGNTVLALAAILIGMPVPILLWAFGARLRDRSSLAAKPGSGPGMGMGPGSVAGKPPNGPVLSEKGVLPSHTVQHSAMSLSSPTAVSIQDATLPSLAFPQPVASQKRSR